MSKDRGNRHRNSLIICDSVLRACWAHWVDPSGPMMDQLVIEYGERFGDTIPSEPLLRAWVRPRFDEYHRRYGTSEGTDTLRAARLILFEGGFGRVARANNVVFRMASGTDSDYRYESPSVGLDDLAIIARPPDAMDTCGTGDLFVAEGEGPVYALDLALRESARLRNSALDSMGLVFYGSRDRDAKREGSSAAVVTCFVYQERGREVYFVSARRSRDILSSCFLGLNDLYGFGELVEDMEPAFRPSDGPIAFLHVA